MDKYDIGGFAIWEKNDDGDAVIRYLDDNIKRLTVRNLDILNVIIDFSIKYDTFITAQEIADTLKANGKLDHDRDTVKHALNRIRKQNEWGRIIVSSPTGYMIKCEPISSISQQSLSREELNVSISDPDDFDAMDPLSIPVPVPKGELPIIDNSPVLITRPSYEVYISNFIRDNESVRTFFYDTDSRCVFDVIQPLTLISDIGSNISYEDICFNDLYKDSNHYRYVVSAPIGSGKSILARKLALEAASEFSEYGVIPILYDLSGFTETDKSLFDILKDEYESYIPGEDTDPFSAFTAGCQNGEVLLLLDNFDMLSNNLRNLFVRKLKAFLRSYSNNTIIIFSRPIEMYTELDSFTVLGIKQVIGEESNRLIDSMLNQFGREIEDLKKHVISKQGLSTYKSNLYGNPLFISIICKEHKHFFSFRTFESIDYLESFIKYAIGEEDSSKHKHTSKTFMSFKEIDDELCAFCFYLVVSNCESFDAINVNDCWNAFNTGKRFTAHEFLDDLCNTYGLITYKNGKYSFIDDLIVSYFYARSLIKHRLALSSIEKIVNNCYAYSADNILDLLYEMDSNAVSKNIYCPFVRDFAITNTNTEYEEFLIRFYPQLEYYVGKGDIEVDNKTRSLIYSHLIKDWGAYEDINHLVFPPIESIKRVAIYKVDETLSDVFVNCTFVEEWDFKLRVRNYEYYRPVGYKYKFNMKDALQNKDENNLILRKVLMSNDFPLRKEFEEVISLCEEQEAEG